ncbi:CIA30 family protein [Burkholderiaceae bacterium UC74_6]
MKDFQKIAPWLAIAIGIAAACQSGAKAATVAAESASFAVHDATVFDGKQRLEHMDVLVKDGRIAAIAPVSKKLVMPAGVPVVQGAGKTLLPGLIDAHVHSWGTARRDALRLGVTTELDMFTDPRQLPAARRERESLAAAQGADLWSAGTLATAPGGHGTEYGFKIPTLTKPEEAEGFVATRQAEGSDYLKIVIENGSAYGHPMATLDGPIISALTKAARSRGMLSVAHVATADDARLAFQSGVDGLAHMFIDRPLDPSKPADAAFIEQARKHFIVATLAVNASLSGKPYGRELTEDPRLAPWLSTTQKGSLSGAFGGDWSKPHFIVNAMANTRTLHAAGVPILAGTDAGNPGTAHGASLHGELALLVQSGLTPAEALSAATAEPARIFGLKDRGQIAVGRRADLLLVEGDPTKDITTTRAIVGLWKNGLPVDRSLQPDEKPGVAAAKAPTSTLIADFAGEGVAARIGQPFMVSTDAMMGGKSTATLAVKNGALAVQGTVDGGLPYAWAGALWMAGTKPMDPVDFAGRKELVFKVRGPARSATAMIFSGEQAQGRPATLPFTIQPEWTEVRLPLDKFNGADLAHLRALAFTAGLPAGEFTFELDDIELR